MNKKAAGIILGALVGAIGLGLCTSSGVWAIVGGLLGAAASFVFILGQIQMRKDRETGLDG